MGETCSGPSKVGCSGSRLGPSLFFLFLFMAVPAAYGSSATQDPSCIFDLHCSLLQHQIPNPLSKPGMGLTSSWILNPLRHNRNSPPPPQIVSWHFSTIPYTHTHTRTHACTHARTYTESFDSGICQFYAKEGPLASQKWQW